MPSYLTTNTIVLRHDTFREKDRRVLLYTETRGKMEAVARSALAVCSKLAGHIEPLSLVRVMIAQGRVFDHIAGAVLVNPFKYLRRNFRAYTCASFICEATYRLIKPEEPDGYIYHELTDALHKLNTSLHAASTDDFWWRTPEGGIALVYIWRLLAQLGYKPELTYCIICKTAKDSAYFDCDHGGYVCDVCARTVISRARYALPNPARTLLQELFAHDMQPNIDAQTLKQGVAVIVQHLLYHTEKPLYSTTSFRYSTNLF